MLRVLPGALVAMVVLGIELTPAWGQVPPPIHLDVPLIQQRTPAWCWLAVSEMSLRYRQSGAGPTQAQILEVRDGLPPGACARNPHLFVRPANDMREIQDIIAQFGGHSTTETPPLGPMDVHKSLAANKLVILGFHMGEQAHVVVVRGIFFEQKLMATPWGPRAQVEPFLVVNDPSFSTPQVARYDNLARLWLSSIVVE